MFHVKQILLANHVISGAGRAFADLIAGQRNRLAMSLEARRRTPAPTHKSGVKRVGQQYLKHFCLTESLYMYDEALAPLSRKRTEAMASIAATFLSPVAAMLAIASARFCNREQLR